MIPPIGIPTVNPPNTARRPARWAFTPKVARHFLLFHVYQPLVASFGKCSVAQVCPTLCHPMDCSMPGFPVHHQLPELIQTYVHQVGDSIQPSHPLSSIFSSCLQSFLASGTFPKSWLLASGGQSIGASVSASVLPANIPVNLLSN